MTSTITARMLALAAAALLVAAALPAMADDEEPPTSFEVGELFFELNDTDGDLGIHGTVDGEEWKSLVLKPAKGRTLLKLAAKGSLRKQGMTELGFESAEPTFDELAPADFFARFPEGDYQIKGRTLDGDKLTNVVTITHVMPAPPVFDAPPSAPCDAPVVVTAPVTIDWQPVTGSHPTIGTPGPVVVERYELAIEREDLGLDFFLTLPPGVTAFPVPSIFTDVPGVIKFEVLVKAEGGNRTASESCFAIE